MLILLKNLISLTSSILCIILQNFHEMKVNYSCYQIKHISMFNFVNFAINNVTIFIFLLTINIKKNFLKLTFLLFSNSETKYCIIFSNFNHFNLLKMINIIFLIITTFQIRKKLMM